MKIFDSPKTKWVIIWSIWVFAVIYSFYISNYNYFTCHNKKNTLQEITAVTDRGITNKYGANFSKFHVAVSFKYKDKHYHVNIPKDFRDYSTENIKVYIYEPLDLSGTIKIVRSKIVIPFVWGDLFIIGILLIRAVQIEKKRIIGT